MKYLLTLLLSVTLSHYSKGQMSSPQKAAPSTVVGKIAPMGTFYAELSFAKNEADDKDTTYTLRFRNFKYTHIDSYESVQFSGIDGTADALYNAFKSVFLPENKSNKDYLIHFSLGKDVVAISHTKSMGITSAMFLVKDAYFALTEKQIDKLFGKN